MKTKEERAAFDRGVLGVLSRSDIGVRFDRIAGALNLPETDRRELDNSLQRLRKAGKITFSSGGWSLASQEMTEDKALEKFQEMLEEQPDHDVIARGEGSGAS